MRKGFAFLALVFVAAAATAQVASFRAVLTGANETPAAADPDGLGNGFFTLDGSAGTVTFNLCFFNINPPTAAHIHRGGSNFTGGIIIPFSAPFVNGCSTGTVTGVATSLISEIIANPAGFYANIHNADFPGGAVRGRVRRRPSRHAHHAPSRRGRPGSADALRVRGPRLSRCRPRARTHA